MRYPGVESSALDFKREIPKNDQIVKTIIGFCNQNGGKLIIGVSDSGEVEGVDQAHIENLLESIEKAIFESTYPPIIPRVSCRSFGEKTILEIEVSAGMSKPYYRKTEGKETGTYIRLGRATLKATPELIKELEWQSSGLSFETIPIYRCNKNEIDKKKFEKFLKNRKIRAKIRQEEGLLKSYGLVIEEYSSSYPTAAGILLFGKNPQKYLSEAIIICSHFKGDSGRDIIATIDCEGALFDQIDQAEEFILSRLSRSFQIKSTKREETLEIPHIALREALLNAVVHRNYHIKAPIKIAIFENRIEIFSPGQFPGPLDTKNLKAGITYLRNPAICKVMREAGYVEKLGSGFIAIFESYEKRNLEDPVVIEGENYIKCILPRVEKTKKTYNEESLIMALFNIYPEITLDLVQSELSTSRSTAARKINALIKKGLLVRVGKTRGVRYRCPEATKQKWKS